MTSQSVKKLLKVDENVNKIYIFNIMEKTREDLINAISLLSDYFFRYLKERSDLDESERDDRLCHVARMVIVSLATCANYKIIFDLEDVKEKLFEYMHDLNSFDGIKELQKIWVETHGRLVSYKDLRGG